jgi:hypothetical protein
MAKERIARTYAELAEALGMQAAFPEPILARLARRPGFPGKPGTPGKREAYLPVEQIRSWLAQHGAAAVDEEAQAAQRRIALLKLEREERDTLVELGRLADVEEIGKFIGQQIANAKAILLGIPDEVESMLPGEIAAEVRGSIGRKIERRLAAVLNELARMAKGDDDNDSDDPIAADDAGGVAPEGPRESSDVDDGTRKARPRRGSRGDKVRPKRPAVVGRRTGSRRGSADAANIDPSQHAGGKDADADRAADLAGKKRPRSRARRSA